MDGPTQLVQVTAQQKFVFHMENNLENLHRSGKKFEVAIWMHVYAFKITFFIYFERYAPPLNYWYWVVFVCGGGRLYVFSQFIFFPGIHNIKCWHRTSSHTPKWYISCFSLTTECKSEIVLSFSLSWLASPTSLLIVDTIPLLLTDTTDRKLNLVSIWNVKNYSWLNLWQYRNKVLHGGIKKTR